MLKNLSIKVKYLEINDNKNWKKKESGCVEGNKLESHEANSFETEEPGTIFSQLGCI